MLLLLHGDNSFESYAELNRLTKVDDVDVTIINGESINNANEIFASAQALSLFSKNSLTIVKRFWQNPKKKSLQEIIIKKLEASGSANLDLIFWDETNVTSVKNKFVKGKKKIAEADPKKTQTANLAKYISENGEIKEFRPLQPQYLRSWLTTELSNKGLQIPANLTEQIILKIGENQFILSSEIEKLALYLRSQKRQQLLREDLEILTVYHQESKIWDMTDAIFRRNRPLALKILNSMLNGPEDFPMLVSATLKQIKLIYLAKLFPSDSKKLMSKFGVKPYTYSKISQFANSFSLEKLRMLFSKLVNLDFTVKQGKIDVKLGFNLLLITL